jgi:O-acetylserine/cysteine efflux transporter
MGTRAPVVALVVAAISWGTATTGTKYALRGFDPIGLLAVELVLATIVLWLVVAFRGFHRPRSLGRVMVLGLFEPALAYLSETIGLAHTSATNGALIQGFECVFVVILAAAILREHINRAVGVAIALAVVGLIVLESGDRLVGPGVGDALLLLGSLSAAAYTIVARGLQPDDDALSVTALQFTTACALAVPTAALAWGTGAEPLPLHVQWQYAAAAAAIGIIGYAGSFVLYNFAIATVAAAPSAIVINLIPAFGFASAVVLLDESPTGYAVVGAFLICASVAIFAVLEAFTEGAEGMEVTPQADPIPGPSTETAAPQSIRLPRDVASVDA